VASYAARVLVGMIIKMFIAPVQGKMELIKHIDHPIIEIQNMN
jgi:hypothetical protein